MAKLRPEGEKIVAGLAEQYKVGADAVKIMMDALAKGGGTMAQFNVPEFGGAGQWMRGGATMLTDMLNSTMKATVDNLCTDLSNLMAAQASFFAPMGQPEPEGKDASAGGEAVSPPAGWWPSELGTPSSSGSRDSLRYAYFSEIRRLAIDLGGRVDVYDTTGYNIQGLGPRQSAGAPVTFISHRGPVSLDAFPRVYGMGGEIKSAPERKVPEAKSAAPEAAPSKPAGADAGSIIALIEQLGGLKEKGILTEEEFAAKKAELLKRL